VATALSFTVAPRQAQAQTAPTGAPPNIVIIWGDDIGQSNISAYTNGLVGYRTPNITASPMAA
jgi:arylsulfatase